MKFLINPDRLNIKYGYLTDSYLKAELNIGLLFFLQQD